MRPIVIRAAVDRTVCNRGVTVGRRSTDASLSDRRAEESQARWRAKHGFGEGTKSIAMAKLAPGKRPVAARHSAIDMNLGFPRPRQQFVETVYGVSVDHTRERIAQVGVGLNVIQLAGFDQRTQYGPSIAAAGAAREEMIFSFQSDARVIMHSLVKCL
jgi:hypothetical protein